MDLRLFLNWIKNTEITDDSEKWINKYAEEWLKLIKNQEDFKILESEINYLPMLEENLLILKILMKISENISVEFKNPIMGCLYKKIIKQFNLNKLDYIYLIVPTYISLEPDIKSVQNIMDLTDSWWMYNYLLKYCLKKDKELLDKKYISKSFEIFHNNYQDYDYTPIITKEVADYIIKSDLYSKAFADFILKNGDFFIELLEKRKFKIENLKPFILLYPNYFWNILLNIIKTIFEKRNHQLSHELDVNTFLECIICIIKNKEIKSGLENLISDNNNWIFNISVYIFCWFVELGFFDVITKNNLYDYMIIEIYYSLSNKKNKKKFYDLNKEVIDKNKKLSKEGSQKNKRYVYNQRKKISKNISSLIKINDEEKRKNNWIILTPQIFKLFIDNQNLFNNSQIEYVIEQVHEFLKSEKTDLRNPDINIIIKQESEQSRTLTFNKAWFIFDMFDCLKVARLLNVDLSQYKRKIISLLPYTLTNEFNLVLTILNDIWVHSIIWEDLDWLLNIYKNEICGDLYLLDPCKIFDLIERWYVISGDINEYQIKVINDLYEKFLDYGSLSIYQIEDMINSMKKFKAINKDFLQEKFKELLIKFKNINYFEDYIWEKLPNEDIKEYKKLLGINEVLICVFWDESAINRRFDQYKELNTDYIVHDDNLEFFRWISKAEDEFFLKDRFYKKLYEPLIENIHYPDYSERFIWLFELIKKFNITGMVRYYLYDILKNYFKDAGKDLLKICLDYGDNIFVWKYMKEFLTEEQINKFNDIKKDVLISNQYEKIDGLKKENFQLKKDLQKKWKITLYVEGKTDKKYLEKAMEKLGINLKINILICWWASNVFTSLAWVIDDRIWWIHIWLLDLDGWWLANWAGKDLSNRLFNSQNYKWIQNWYFGNKILENLLKTWLKRSRYSLILLPRTDRFTNQIFIDWKPNLWVMCGENSNEFLSNIGIFNWGNLEYPIFKTEHLIYNDNMDEYYYSTIKLPWWWEIIDFCDKNKKIKLCEKIMKWEIDIPIENWKNFKRIFDYIDEIQKEL